MLPNWTTASRVNDDIFVIRLKKITKLHFCEDHKTPSGDMFILSDEDKQQGIDRKMQPLLSVWDENVPHGEYPRIRRLPDEHMLLIFKAKTEKLRALEFNPACSPVEVHKDPLEEDSAVGHLHYGVQGFYNHNSSKEFKNYFKNLRERAAEICEFDSSVTSAS